MRCHFLDHYAIDYGIRFIYFRPFDDFTVSFFCIICVFDTDDNPSGICFMQDMGRHNFHNDGEGDPLCNFCGIFLASCQLRGKDGEAVTLQEFNTIQFSQEGFACRKIF